MNPTERDRASYFPDNFACISKEGPGDLVDGDAEILPGISVACIPGHNTNIQAVVITAGGKTSPLLQIYYRRVTIFLCPGSWLTTSTRYRHLKPNATGFRALLRRTESLSSAKILTSPRRRSISGTAKLKSNRSI